MSRSIVSLLVFSFCSFRALLVQADDGRTIAVSDVPKPVLSAADETVEATWLMARETASGSRTQYVLLGQHMKGRPVVFRADADGRNAETIIVLKWEDVPPEAMPGILRAAPGAQWSDDIRLRVDSDGIRLELYGQDNRGRKLAVEVDADGTTYVGVVIPLDDVPQPAQDALRRERPGFRPTDTVLAVSIALDKPPHAYKFEDASPSTPDVRVWHDGSLVENID